jgi:hypothetical protein
VIERCSRTAYNSPNRTQWTLLSRLEDLDFAEDIGTLLDLFALRTLHIKLLYGSETWREKSFMKSVQVFVNKFQRNILGTRWPDSISHEIFWKRTKQQPVDVTNRTRR